MDVNRNHLALIALLAAAVALALKRRADPQTRLHVDAPGSANDRLLAGVRNLKLDAFHVPLVFSSSLAQLAWLALGWKLRGSGAEPTCTQQLTLPGGENVFLDWFHPPQQQEEGSSSTPIAIYLPGITGRLAEAAMFVERVRERGHIAIVFHRRGHLQPLKLPEFNIFGNATDLKFAVESIAREFPHSPVCLVGSSAGTAVMVRYLGEFDAHPQVKCAVGLSPGYDIEHVWHRIRGTVLDWYVLRGLKRFFLDLNRATLARKNARAVQSMDEADTVHAFALAASVFVRHDDAASSCCVGEEETATATYEAWLEVTCPVRVVQQIAVPTLCLNSLDDPICLRGAVESLGYRLPFENPFCALLTTEIGSHCAHQDFSSTSSWLPNNWGHTVALDFFEGVIQS